MKKVGDILREYLRERGWLTGNPYAPLFSGWSQVAGSTLAAHTRLRDVREGVLVVEADHPGWLQMARMRQEAILSAAREAAPDARIVGVRLVLSAPEP